MTAYRYILILIRERSVKTYSFKAVLEQDGKAWAAYCPALLT
jgi:hypothetical protein